MTRPAAEEQSEEDWVLAEPLPWTVHHPPAGPSEAASSGPALTELRHLVKPQQASVPKS